MEVISSREFSAQSAELSNVLNFAQIHIYESFQIYFKDLCQFSDVWNIFDQFRDFSAFERLSRD